MVSRMNMGKNRHITTLFFFFGSTILVMNCLNTSAAFRLVGGAV